MKQKYFLILETIIITLGIILINGCVQQPETESKLEFFSGLCDETIDPYNESNLGINKTLWLNNTTLEVKVYVSINCAETVIKGDYKIQDNKIILEYEKTQCDPCTTCMCVHELIYKFTNLEKKDYQFELELEKYCTKTGTNKNLSLTEAKQIALASECVKEGPLKEVYFCNNDTGTWWIDLDIEKEGCNPACVINVVTKEAEINWRCTGVL